MNIETLVNTQRSFYRTHRTKDLAVRKAALRRLRAGILHREEELQIALKSDLNKATMESYMSEIGMVLSEITYQLRHIDRWAKGDKVHTPLAQFAGSSYRLPEPYGVVLVMAPWNYPFQLCLEPAIGAIAAGNTVIIKPSAYAPATSRVMAELIRDCFDEEYVAVVEGGREENTLLLEQRFDYIFFTGGVSVGKLVMEKASRYLTPISLELGGKSPCIVDQSADLKIAARRIAFGKYLNAGQTCVAPDHVFVHKSVKNEFLAYLQHSLTKFFGEDPLHNENYPHIVNDKHYQRLLGLMKQGSICIGGQCDSLQRIIEPTVIENITPEDPIMQEEIFGPLLPILTFEDLDEVITQINDHEKPLALYLFTKKASVEEKILKECSFGGGCINDTIIHLATSHMGFGGVGMSGMGSYHGDESFKTFSHYRSIVKKATWIDLPFRYHPYTKTKDKLVRLFMR